MTNLNMPYDQIRAYIAQSHPLSVIMLGCDSVRVQKKDGMYARYAAVVCVRKASGVEGDVMYHGCKVFGAMTMLKDYGKVIKSGKMYNLKQRLIQEVAFTLEVFDNIQDIIEDRPFEIHIDVSKDPQSGSHVAFDEAKGYVMGVTNGRVPLFKPNALAASFAADAMAHGEIAA